MFNVSVPILSERFLNSLLSFKADGGNDDSIVLIDCLNGSTDHGAPSSLASILADVGISREDVIALMESGDVAEDALDILDDIPPQASISPLGAPNGIIILWSILASNPWTAPLGRERLHNLPVHGFHYIALHILWIAAPLGRSGRLLLLACRRGVKIILEIVSITGIPLTIFFLMICGTGHT